jgi:hypothetical protein
MWGWADDYGVGEWTPRELLGFAFPNDEEVGNAEFQCLLTEVAACFHTTFYTVAGRRFYCIPNWDDHQKNERRAVGKYPRPDDAEAAPDQQFYEIAEMRGSSVQTNGVSGSGTGNREQGKGTGEQGTSAAQMEAEFEAAWAHWPKKVERKAALEAYKKATKKVRWDFLLDAISRFGDAYAIATTKQYTPALGVWLANERWDDELPEPPAANRQPTRTEQNLGVVAQYAQQERLEIQP